METDGPRGRDRRAAYTRKVIREAFVSLFRAKPVEQITIAEICKQAEINRSTFYLHYARVRQVLEELENEIYEKITGFIRETWTGESKRVALSGMMFRWLKENPEYIALADPRGYSGVTRRIADYGKEITVELCLKSGQLSRRQAEIWAAYVVNGALAAVWDLVSQEHSNLEEENAFLDRVIQYGNGILDMEKLNKAMRAETAAG